MQLGHKLLVEGLSQQISEVGHSTDSLRISCIYQNGKMLPLIVNLW